MSNYDPVRLAHWRNVLDEQARSGLTIQAFCQKRGVSKSKFHHWKAILLNLDSGPPKLPQAQPQTQLQPKSGDTPLSACFVPVRVVSDTLVQITLANGVQLQLPLNANVEQLARLVKAVAAC
jgi:hypothetical protein